MSWDYKESIRVSGGQSGIARAVLGGNNKKGWEERKSGVIWRVLNTLLKSHNLEEFSHEKAKNHPRLRSL
jgi:hypothetical protein